MASNLVIVNQAHRVAWLIGLIVYTRKCERTCHTWCEAGNQRRMIMERSNAGTKLLRRPKPNYRLGLPSLRVETLRKQRWISWQAKPYMYYLMLIVESFWMIGWQIKNISLQQTYVIIIIVSFWQANLRPRTILFRESEKSTFSKSTFSKGTFSCFLVSRKQVTCCMAFGM